MLISPQTARIQTPTPPAFKGTITDQDIRLRNTTLSQDKKMLDLTLKIMLSVTDLNKSPEGKKLISCNERNGSIYFALKENADSAIPIMIIDITPDGDSFKCQLQENVERKTMRNNFSYTTADFPKELQDIFKAEVYDVLYEIANPKISSMLDRISHNLDELINLIKK